MVRQIVAAAMRDAEIDEIAERLGSRIDRLRRVLDVQVEDDARVPLARPRQKGLVILLDEPDGAVDDVRTPGSERAAGIFHESIEALADDVDLRDHLARLYTPAEGTVEVRVV